MDDRFPQGFYLILTVNSQGITSRPTSPVERIFHPHEEDDHHEGKHDHEEHEEQRHDEHEDHLEESTVDYLTWLQASLAIVLISLCGIFGVLIIPIMKKLFYQHLLQFLIALGKVSLMTSVVCSLMFSSQLSGR